MVFLPLPRSAAWSHRYTRTALEVAFFESSTEGYVLAGCTTAVEDASPWLVSYRIAVDTQWRTRHAEITGRSEGGPRSLVLDSDGEGRWSVDGIAQHELEGCFDLDLESSALTNTLPVHRLALPPGASSQAPAAYVRAHDLSFHRLEQQYARTHDPSAQRYSYAAPSFDFSCELTYDAAGLVLTYPGIATRLV
ncbi:putative glycolipid-binding domain-containing protein [Allobranchiibius sp. GilTou73]|uniref:putative glycolipid-binding domain-containing protein n=1 Tax=Allobranchiibius sp. GilTou73 TaxID=2904523 RepID=UPI001F3516CB|nr:putative glycolipid-binding domain-containing protein [Allobranchiibius sp. GilTou73]UIJ33761.1 putative glycolipid-binding domain-containing protein [Allobranchiibius sp. GilTou73]